VLQVIGHNPLYGNRSGKHMTTYWLAFVKFEDDERQDIDLFENINDEVREMEHEK
jgi:hypothetical protein